MYTPTKRTSQRMTRTTASGGSRRRPGLPAGGDAALRGATGLCLVALLLAGPLAAQTTIECPSEFDLGAGFPALAVAGQALLEAGCHGLSLEIGRQLEERARAVYGEESLEMAAALDLQVENSFWLRQRDEAVLALSEQAVAIREGRPEGAPEALARTLQYRGALLSSRHHSSTDVEAAWASYSRARAIFTAELGAASQEVAGLVSWMAELVHEWGGEGEATARRTPWIAALADPATAAGRSVLEILGEVALAASGSDGGQLAAARLTRDPALAMALRAVALGRAAGGDGRGYAEALNGLGNLLNRRQLYDEALWVFDRCLDVRLRVYPPGHHEIARSYHNRGVSLMLVGELDAARPDLEAGYLLRAAYADEGFRGMVATSLRMLGKLLFMTGDLQAAVSLYGDALPRLRETYGASHWRYAGGLADLAEAYEELGETSEARGRYEQALAILERSPEGELTAAVRARLGTLLVASGDVDGGTGLLEQARRAQEAMASLPVEDYARTLGGLAQGVEAGGRKDRALELRQGAIGALERYQGIHPELVDALLAAAELEVELRSTDAAATLARAGELLPRLGEAAYAARARHHYLRARLADAGGDATAALADATSAAALYARHLAPAVRLLPPDSGLRLALQNRRSLDLMLALLGAAAPGPEPLARAWETVARNRGLVADELERRGARARASTDPDLRRRLAALDDARRLLAETQVRVRRVATLEERQGLLRWADARVQAAERAVAELAAQERAGEADEDASADFGFAELAARLPARSALVSFVRSGSGVPGHAARYGAFVVHAGAPRPRFVDLGAAEEIDWRVGDWRASLVPGDGGWDGSEARLRRSGLGLRRAVWDPVARLAGSAERYFIVPDGALFLLSFAALPGRADGAYLVEEGFEIHHLVSERDLLRRPSPTPGPAAILAVGEPDFDAGLAPAHLTEAASRRPPSFLERAREITGELLAEFLRDPCLGESTLYFLPLPGAREEASEVVEIFRRGTGRRGAVPAVTELAGAEATETAFKRLAPAHSVVHVATHGFFDLECGRGGVTRGLGDLLADPAGRPAAVAGLAFAGANRERGFPTSGDDGILTAPEIAGLDLSAVEWVVLSACETAVGQVAAGEGVLGLARSFRVAGAGTLILSLWPVEDDAAREWMGELYRARFDRGEPTPRAVRQASLQTLDRRRRDGRPTHPFFWASFVAVGAWN